MKPMQSFLHEVPGHQDQSANHQHTLMPQVRASVLMCVWWEKVEWCSVAGGNTSLTYVTLKYISKEFRPEILPRTSSPFFCHVFLDLHLSWLLSAYSYERLPPFLWISLVPSGHVMTVRMECVVGRVCKEQEGAWREIVLGASWMEGRRGFEKVWCFRNVAWRDRHQPPAASFGLHSDLPDSPNTLMGWGVNINTSQNR